MAEPSTRPGTVLRTSTMPTRSLEHHAPVRGARWWREIGWRHVVAVVMVVVCVLPLLYVRSASFNPGGTLTGSNQLFRHVSGQNYQNLWGRYFGQWLLNSLLVCTVTAVGTVLMGAAAAYAFSRFRFRGRGAVLGMFLLATLVPGVTTQVATFQIIHALGLYNTRWALILLFMGTDIVSIYIFIQFMRSIPRSLDEAATLDGAGHLRIFFQVIVPNLKPAIATVVIIKGIGIYNEFYAPFLYITDPKLRPISTALFAFKGPFGAHWEIISAGVVITIVPILLLFLFLQKYIYNGFTSGATK